MVEQDALWAVPFFTGLGPTVVAALADRARDVRLEAQALLIEQGADASEVFFLLDGSLEVLLDCEGVGALFMGTHEQVGTLIGWSAFSSSRRYTDSVRCHSPSHLLQIPAVVFDEVMAGDPVVGHELLRRVNVQVAQQLETTRRLIDGAMDQTQEL